MKLLLFPNLTWSTKKGPLQKQHIPLFLHKIRCFYSLRITTLRKIIIALPIMRNNSTILRTTIIRTNTPNHNSIRSRTASRIRASTQDRKLQVRGWARECKALVVFVLVRIVVIAYGLAFGVVGECCGGGVVDVGLAVICSWGFVRG